MTPEHPYPSFSVYSPGADSRIIPWMTWKYNVDGYLFWCTNFFDDANTTSTPANKWPSREWTYQNSFTTPGDGQLTYPGPSGQPLSSIRLENFRDGMEDYEYCALLKAQLTLLDAAHLTTPEARTLKLEAKRLLAVDATVARNCVEWANDPDNISNYRDRLGNTIHSIKSILAQ